MAYATQAIPDSPRLATPLQMLRLLRRRRGRQSLLRYKRHPVDVVLAGLVCLLHSTPLHLLAFFAGDFSLDTFQLYTGRPASQPACLLPLSRLSNVCSLCSRMPHPTASPLRAECLGASRSRNTSGDTNEKWLLGKWSKETDQHAGAQWRRSKSWTGLIRIWLIHNRRETDEPAAIRSPTTTGTIDGRRPHYYM